MTTLLLRADGGPSIGVGHVSRCLAYAEAATERGWRTLFAGDLGGASWLADRFAALDVPLLPAAALDDLDHLDADVVLVDHYGLGELPGVRARARLVSLEDGPYGRRAADVVVDSGLVLPPRPVDGSTLFLGGPRFAPLRADIVAARRARASGHTAGDPPRVVVVMGGGAAGPTVGAALTALRDTKLPLSAVAVAAGEVELPAAAAGQRFEVRPPTPGLAGLFATADLVVSAAGVTLTELCGIGVPTALVRLVDNQAAGYAAALGRGLAVGLGGPADLPDAAQTLRHVLRAQDLRAALTDTALSTVDGKGVDRVLDVATLAVRHATEADADLLLEWRNDPETRAWSRGHQSIAGPVHRAWLAAAVVDPNRLLHVVERAGDPLGLVRFDLVGPATWEVGIVVAPARRGRGLATEVLMAGEGALHARVDVRTVLANVHEDNAASQALFRRAGYTAADRPADGPYVWLAKHTPRG